MEIPAVDIGDPVSGRTELMIRLAAKEPLTRPATNADWIDPLVNLASVAALAAGPTLILASSAVEAVGSADVAALSTDTTAYRTTFGKVVTNDYRGTFFRTNPKLESRVVVHHAVPQRTLMLYPDEVTEPEIHSIENLRGIPNGRIV